MILFLDFRRGKGFNRGRTFLILALFAIAVSISSLLFLQSANSPRGEPGSFGDDEEVVNLSQSQKGAADVRRMNLRQTIDPDVVESVILVGDGGTPDLAALELLRSEANLLPDATRVIFLGDNVYTHGVVAESDPKHSSTIEILNRQVAAAGKEYFFVPGNHDWDYSGPDGWNAVRRQSQYLNTTAGRTVGVPSNGCPGPEVAFATSSFKVVAADTEWWLRNLPKPQTSTDGCSTWTRPGITSRLAQLASADSASQIVMFVSHHPLESDGPHGRGSRCFQDAGCPTYASMKREILNSWGGKQPLICAAGHDHLLQVITDRPGCGYYLTSGTISHPTSVRPRAGSLFASAETGLIRIDLQSNGKLTLTVRTVAGALRDGRPAFEYQLDRSKGAAQ